MTKIKLCGLSQPQDIDAANELQPEFIGFVFARRSKRYVDPAAAAALRARLAPGITAVGVFVDVDVPFISSLAKNGTIDWIQLHCNADAKQLKELREAAGVPIIQACQVSTAMDATDAVKSSAEHILFDAGAGNGETFDWSVVSGIERPFFLAGGLTPANVAEAIRQVHPAAVDVSSGIELNGRKDADLMRQFVAAVREEADL